MSKAIEKYNKTGIKTSYVSTIIGISLVLFMIGIVLSGMFGLSNLNFRFLTFVLHEKNKNYDRKSQSSSSKQT